MSTIALVVDVADRVRVATWAAAPSL